MIDPKILIGTTVNERLVLSGMMKEFEKAIKKDDRIVAYRILKQLKVDEPSIILTVGYIKENLPFPNPWDFPHENSNGLNNEYEGSLEYSNLNEIAMGAPLSGICKLNKNGINKILIDNQCGGAALWNECGTKIAIPIWDKSFFTGIFQKIGILDLKKNTLTKFKKKFRVIDLRTFNKNLISGFDSPIHRTETIEFDINCESIETSYGIK